MSDNDNRPVVGYIVTDDGEMKPLREGDDPHGTTETATASAYSALTKTELEAEVARRNAERDDDDQVAVEGKGTKADLVAALEADDEVDSTNE